MAAIRDLERVYAVDKAIAIAPLTAMLGDNDLEVRTVSIEALGRIGVDAVRVGSEGVAVRAAVTTLIGMQGDPQPSIRLAVASSLGHIASARTGVGVGPVAVGKTKAADASTGSSLLLLDTDEVVATLVGMLSDRDAKVRHAAVSALGEIGSAGAPPAALARGLKDESADVRALTVSTLCGYRLGLDPWLPLLIHAAEHDDEQSVRELCVGSLRAITRPAVSAASVPALIFGLGSHDLRLRTAVTNILGRLGHEADSAVPALLRIFDEPFDAEEAKPESARRELVWSTAMALGKIGPGSPFSDQAIKHLTEVARSAHPTRQGWAAWVLGQFGHWAAAAIPVLIAMLREAVHTPDVDNEVAAAEALGLIASETSDVDEVVTSLLPVLESASSHSRTAAVQALQRFGPKAAIAAPRIRALRGDPDAHVRQVAASALLALEGQSKP